MRILGIDPGTLVVGYGLIQLDGRRYHSNDYGCIRIERKLPFPQRLKLISDATTELLLRTMPDVVAVEEVYVSQNAKTTLRLGHARGVILLAAVNGGHKISEYAPREVKQAVVGKGGASKRQVVWMVSQILALPSENLKEDAADALAVALCHGLRNMGNRIPVTSKLI